ncbi:hypothetical protein EJD97_001697 [Solanum chilense]|uniref:Retrotransposon gag domain-containing protein n=1 Tax=Solanum chilense TaxID=4083 RepID=A0A6N2C5F4_SOLCI|nr:hypothetical protein EJD97_001697 [Solanum chilense]
MNIRRNAGRRVGEAAAGGNQAPPQAPAARVQAITALAQAITVKDTREGCPRENPHASTVASVNEEEKAELSAYQLKYVAHVWYKMWMDGGAPGNVPITRDVLNTAFLERFFPREQREAKSGHMIRDCPHVKNHTKADTQPQPNPTAAAKTTKRNRFDALKGREEQEKSANVVTGLIHSLGTLTLADIDHVSIMKSCVSPTPKRGGTTGKSDPKHAIVHRY